MSVNFIAVGCRDFDRVFFAASHSCQYFLSDGTPGVAIVDTSGLRQIPQVAGLTLSDSLQSEIGKWIQAENPYLDLPTVLPDSSFGTVTHLLPNSAREYTRQLCLMLSQ